MTGFDRQTLEFYAAEAPVYTASGKGGVSRFLAAFADMLPSGASVLELGCGGGVDAEYLIERGFAVDPTDGVAEIAAKASKRLGRAVAVMRFDELAAENAYDAVLASASLLHVPRPQLPAILTRIRRALRPEGLHLATYKGGGEEGRDRFGRYFNYMDQNQLLAAYRQAGSWRELDLEEGMGGGYDGFPGPWVRVIARK